jgi:hypothetical protein
VLGGGCGRVWVGEGMGTVGWVSQGVSQGCIPGVYGERVYPRGICIEGMGIPGMCV